jgi:hypothetical protein
MVASNCAIALGMLKYEDAFEKILERLRNIDNLETFLGIIHYLGCIRQDDSHSVLKSVFAQFSESDYAGTIAESLLAQRDPADVSVILDALFIREDNKFRTDMFLRAIMRSIKADGFYGDLTDYGRENIIEAPEEAVDKLITENKALNIMADLRNEIIKKIQQRRYQDLVSSLLFEAGQMVRSRFTASKVPDFLSETYEHDNLSQAILEWFAKNHSKWSKTSREAESAKNLVSAILACYLGINGREGYLKALGPDASVDELMNTIIIAGSQLPESIQKRVVKLSPGDKLKDALSDRLLTWGDIWKSVRKGAKRN